eukprot:TRINITY_DN9028_c0_g1_i1.p1 TRINITY_DN9028_c0_g1~~TRINITY_DN9028_c0_g1_i1.p1  ORF type:complete len:250 (-),score=48.03 TRINITY_DN9028_c0_g1_i1:43-759(-)
MRTLGNIRFIGELYKKNVMSEKIMHNCVQLLVGQNLTNLDEIEEEDVELLCNLLSTVGKKLDHEKAQPHMKVYFQRLTLMSQNKALSSRIRFMCKDVIDLRNRNWIPRQKQPEAKTLEQIRQDEAVLKGSRLPRSNSPTQLSGLGRGGPQDVRAFTILTKNAPISISRQKVADRYSHLAAVSNTNSPSVSSSTGSIASTASSVSLQPSPSINSVTVNSSTASGNNDESLPHSQSWSSN